MRPSSSRRKCRGMHDMSRRNVGTIARRVHAGAAMVFLLVCASGTVKADDRPIFVTSPAQPLNFGDAMLPATPYHDPAAYYRDVTPAPRQATHPTPARRPPPPPP